MYAGTKEGYVSTSRETEQHFDSQAGLYGRITIGLLTSPLA